MKLKVVEFPAETRVSAGGHTVLIRKAGSAYRVMPRFRGQPDTQFSREDALASAEEMLEEMAAGVTR